ncbi:RICIN domain-containing protein [Streptomyces sp. NPDC052396]|uniref:RICIN domain-containing protein n=1 Tax=Streptomyces sp. NPDC052396 TaxID=3365689 RepID=UPI0037CDA427
MSGLKVKSVLKAALLVPAVLLATATAAHADGDVQWDHQHGGGCLTGMWDHHFGWNDVGLYPCSFGAAKWHDINQGDGTWLEQLREVPGYCLAGYTDHDAYIEKCTGNDYQRWKEIDTGHGWVLQNKATQECLDADGNNKVYMHSCNYGDYQLWK